MLSWNSLNRCASSWGRPLWRCTCTRRSKQNEAHNGPSPRLRVGHVVL